jgi:hypothetical protein
MLFTNRWLRNGNPIAGQTGSTYKITEADASASISCEVTAFNGLSAAAVSNSIGPVISTTTLFINAVPFAFDVDNQPYPLDGLETVVVGDTADDGTGIYEVTLAVSAGGNTVVKDPDLIFTVGDGSNDSIMTFQGKLSDINATLASIAISGISSSPPTFTIPFVDTTLKNVVARVFDIGVTDVSPNGALFYKSTVDGVIKFNGKLLTYGV